MTEVTRIDRPRSADWRDYVDDVQGNVDQFLREFAENSGYINSVLGEAYRQSSDKYTEVAAEVIENLDKTWEHHGSRFLVTGSWLYPNGVYGENFIQVEHEREPAFKEAISRGFMARLIPVDGDMEPRIGLSFATKRASIHTPMMIAKGMELLAFAEASKVNLSFMRPDTQGVLSSTMEDVVARMSRAEEALFREISATGDFYQLSAEAQNRFLTSLVEQVEDVMPDPMSRERLMVHDASASEVYFKDPTTQVLASVSSEDENSPVRLAGQVIGAALPDIIINGQGAHYQSPDQLLSARTGMSLVVRPSSLSHDLSRFNHPDVLLPTHNTSYGLVFDTTAY